MDVTRAFHGLSLDVTRESFPTPGLHNLRATLTNKSTGERLDELTRRIWIETDPPFKAPFDVQGVEFPHDLISREWSVRRESDDRATVLYNTAHTAYRDAEEDASAQRRYLFDVFLEAALLLVLEREGDERRPRFHPLDRDTIEKDPASAYVEVVRKAHEIRGKILERALRS